MRVINNDDDEAKAQPGKNTYIGSTVKNQVLLSFFSSADISIFACERMLLFLTS